MGAQCSEEIIGEKWVLSRVQLEKLSEFLLHFHLNIKNWTDLNYLKNYKYYNVRRIRRWNTTTYINIITYSEGNNIL